MASLAIDKPAAVLLDLGLPDRDGLELVPLIKAAGAALIVVSARGDTDQKVAALDLGADDYVLKPFDSEELRARLRTALRHRLAAESRSDKVVLGDVTIDLAARLVTRSGEEVHLTPKEYGMLAELSKHPGRVITHAQLLRAVWGPGHERDVEYLRVAARGIRRKLEADPATPVLLRNEPGSVAAQSVAARPVVARSVVARSVVARSVVARSFAAGRANPATLPTTAP
eukprot:gene13067-13169_t